jgi:hypothetical protein
MLIRNRSLCSSNQSIKLLSLFCLALELTVTIYKVENDSRSSLESNRNNSSLESVDSLMLAKSATRIAILGISTSNLNVRHMSIYFSFPEN